MEKELQEKAEDMENMFSVEIPYKYYFFDNATEFLEGIEKFRERVKNEKLVNFYGITAFWHSGLIDWPVVFLFESFAIEIYFIDISEINIKIYSSEDFLWAIEQSEKTARGTYKIDEDFKWRGKYIKNIKVERFSDAFQQYNLNGPIREPGGDYFDFITVEFDEDCFAIWGNGAWADGYMSLDYIDSYNLNSHLESRKKEAQLYEEGML